MDITTSTTGISFYGNAYSDIYSSAVKETFEEKQRNKTVKAKIALEKRSRDSIKNQRRREQQRIDAKFARRRK